jgi:CheY-like chemotaxis protein
MNIHFLDDDYATNRYHELTLGSIAHQLDAQLSFFSDPEELLKNYSQTEEVPDILFCDVNMPRMKCWEFVDGFVELFPSSKIDIILLTTSLDPTITQKAKDYKIIRDVTVKLLEEQYLKDLIIECRI